MAEAEEALVQTSKDLCQEQRGWKWAHVHIKTPVEWRKSGIESRERLDRQLKATMARIRVVGMQKGYRRTKNSPGCIQAKPAPACTGTHYGYARKPENRTKNVWGWPKATQALKERIKRCRTTQDGQLQGCIKPGACICRSAHLAAGGIE